MAKTALKVKAARKPKFAVRTRVNKSAIGSDMVMGFSGPLSPRYHCAARCDLRCRTKSMGGVVLSFSYQELLVMPGSSPRCAISRRQMRHSPNLR